MDRRLFREQQVRPVQRQVAVNLVRAHLVIPGNAVFPAGIHQVSRAHDIGPQENIRILNAAVHMAFRREVDHRVRLFLLKQGENSLPVTDVGFAEPEIRIARYRLQGGQVSRVGQLVHADDPVLRMLLQVVVDIVSADEPRTAGHDNRHNSTPSIKQSLVKLPPGTCPAGPDQKSRWPTSASPGSPSPKG